MNRHIIPPPKATNASGAPPRRQGAAIKPLTPRQQTFCQEYLVDLNATQAAIRAGYGAAGADSMGTQLLRKPTVLTRVAELQAVRRAKTEVDSDFVLRRLLEEVNADAKDLYGPDGRLLPVPEWPPVWRRGLVSTIRTTEIFGRGEERGVQIGIQTDVVLVDRARRLELLGKHIKVNAFAERVTLGMDTPLQELFKQISGNVIRPRQERHPPLIEHDPDPGERDPDA
jgi:phage terminase small subunit